LACLPQSSSRLGTAVRQLRDSRNATPPNLGQAILRLADRPAALSQKVHRGDRSRRTQRPRLDGISVERPKPSSRHG
jgi:hypothetical protein